MVVYGIALYCIVLHGIAWYCRVLHGIIDNLYKLGQLRSSTPLGHVDRITKRRKRAKDLFIYYYLLIYSLLLFIYLF